MAFGLVAIGAGVALLALLLRGSAAPPSATGGRGSPRIGSGTETGAEDPALLQARNDVEALLSAKDRPARPDLASRLAMPAQAKRIAAALARIDTSERRAIGLLRLLREGGTAGIAFVESAADGGYGEELRIPGILALAGGGDEEVSVLSRIASTASAPARAAAVLALSLERRAVAQTAVGDLLEGMLSAEDRIAFYRALGGAVPDLALGRSFFRELGGKAGEVGLGPDLRYPAPYRRIVAAIAGERQAEAMPAATRVLARLPDPDARKGILEIWERAEGESRGQVFEAALSELPPAGGATLAAMASTATGPGSEEIRRRALDFVRTSRAEGLAAVLRDWAATEQDPGIRDGIAEVLQRLDTVPSEEPR